MRVTAIGIAAVIIVLAVCLGAAGVAEKTVFSGKKISSGLAIQVPDQTDDLQPAAIKHKETVWTGPGNQEVMENFMDGVNTTISPIHYSDAYYVVMKNESAVAITTPFVISTVQNGKKVRTRAVTFAMNMSAGVNVTYAVIVSGPNLLYEGNPSFEGNGAYTEYKVDLGSSKVIDRGLNAGLLLENSNTVDAEVISFGAGTTVVW